MNKTTKNCKGLALILLTSALLIVAAIPNIATVNAQAMDNVYIYNSIGGTIATMGTTLDGGVSYQFEDGTAVTLDAVPDTGYQFLCWEVVNAEGASTPTDSTLEFTPNAADNAIQAMFIPTSNATMTPSGTGTSTIDILISVGGETVPAAGTSYTNYNIGEVNDFQETAGTGFKFLCWIVDTFDQGASIYTDSTLSLNIPADFVSIQAMWIPTDSTVTVTMPTPTPIPELSTIIVALALIGAAAGTIVYKRKTK